MIAAAELIMFEVWACQRLGRVPAPLEPHLEPRQIVEIRLGIHEHPDQLRLHCTRETAAAFADALWRAAGTQLADTPATVPVGDSRPPRTPRGRNRRPQ